MTGRPPSAAGDPVRREGALIARYLVGEPPPPELLDRWADAAGRLFAGDADPVDAAMLAFVQRHPWSLGPLDAAAGLRRPGGLLRAKVLVMAAILETSTRYAGEFLPRDTGLARFLVEAARHGTAAVLRVLAGLALWPAATRPGTTRPDAGAPVATPSAPGGHP